MVVNHEEALELAHIKADESNLARITAERDRFKVALDAINNIRNSIVQRQTVNWSAHIYPIVAALREAGIEGDDYDRTQAQAKAEIEKIKATVFAEVTAERDRLAAILEDWHTVVRALGRDPGTEHETGRASDDIIDAAGILRALSPGLPIDEAVATLLAERDMARDKCAVLLADALRLERERDAALELLHEARGHIPDWAADDIKGRIAAVLDVKGVG